MDIEQSPGIETRIQEMRGIKVMVDADLAKLYGVSTKRLNEQVKRNRARFPGDFMFQLSEAENPDSGQSVVWTNTKKEGRLNTLALIAPSDLLRPIQTRLKSALRHTEPGQKIDALLILGRILILHSSKTTEPLTATRSKVDAAPVGEPGSAFTSACPEV